MPTGVPITLQGIIGLAQSVGGFLFILGGILAGLTLMISGVTYLLAGSDTTKIQNAKGIFKAGLIGSLIIFGMGTIVSLVSSFATDPFDFFRAP